ncbi:MAG: DUF4349 domain-containing protein, partial [Syntrophomonadaceae bacterium]|nr:DUF4349 domain-containing protein [Syntrophomonadaceae bacterium]
QTELAPDLGSAPKSAQNETSADPLSLDRKVVQNASLSLKAPDVAQAADQIITLCGSKGGYTVSSRIYRENDRVSGRLALKVPQAGLLEVIDGISALGEVTDKVISTQDVTEEFYDAQARLKVLEAKEARLLGLMDRAANIAEIISIENELSKTRGEIEVLSGRLQLLANATQYSLININLVEGVPGSVKAPQGTWGKAWQSLINSLNGVINFGSNTLVFLFAAIPWLVIASLLALLVRWMYPKLSSRLFRNKSLTLE